jgi:hypothetical protein
MKEIQREEWAEYLDSFSRRHEGWLATVEVPGVEVGARVEAQELPLRGVTAELKGGEGAITLILGAKGRSASHTTSRARRTSASSSPRAGQT